MLQEEDLNDRAAIIGALRAGRLSIREDRIKFPLTNKWADGCMTEPPESVLTSSAVNEILGLSGDASLHPGTYFWEKAMIICRSLPNAA
jgi:hypothetical protein